MILGQGVELLRRTDDTGVPVYCIYIRSDFKFGISDEVGGKVAARRAYEAADRMKRELAAMNLRVARRTCTLAALSPYSHQLAQDTHEGSTS